MVCVLAYFSNNLAIPSDEHYDRSVQFLRDCREQSKLMNRDERLEYLFTKFAETVKSVKSKKFVHNFKIGDLPLLMSQNLSFMLWNNEMGIRQNI